MEKKELFKKFVTNPTYTSMILQVINEHDFSKRTLVLHFEEQFIELHQIGNDIKVKE